MLDDWGVDMSTVDPNPTVFSYGESSSADDLSSLANVAGQWGTAIASIVTGRPVQTVQTSSGVQTVGAASVVRPSIFSGSAGIILLIAGVIVIILLVRD